ncbi:MAG TPA: sel1 repeat family protein [Deltaproteobacteria bacterium]|nr:sel1 repeat family protein [Deltaproteobacteria bacterium]
MPCRRNGWPVAIAAIPGRGEVDRNASVGSSPWARGIQGPSGCGAGVTVLDPPGARTSDRPGPIVQGRWYGTCNGFVRPAVRKPRGVLCLLFRISIHCRRGRGRALHLGNFGRLLSLGRSRSSAHSPCPRRSGPCLGRTATLSALQRGWHMDVGFGLGHAIRRSVGLGVLLCVACWACSAGSSVEPTPGPAASTAPAAPAPVARPGRAPNAPGATLEERQAACEGGDFEICQHLGTVYWEGLGAEVDRVRASEMFARACEGNVAKACVDVGVLHSMGEGVPEDKEKAAGFFRKACKLGAVGGCYNLGLAYANGEGVERSNQTALALFVDACDRDLKQACLRLEALEQNLR